MQKDAIRQTITAQFYQSIAESGVEVNAIPQNELQAIVSALSDGVSAALEAVMEEDAQMQSAAFSMSAGNSGLESMDTNMNRPTIQDEPPERILWSGRPYMTIGTRYELTTQRLRIFRGILGKTLDEIELVRMRDTRVSQHLGERALKVGDVKIFSNDPSSPEVILENIKDPLGVREMLRKAMLEEKERRGMHYREEM